MASLKSDDARKYQEKQAVEEEPKQGADHLVPLKSLDAALTEEAVPKVLNAKHKESSTYLTSTTRQQQSMKNDSTKQIPHLIRRLVSLSLMDTVPSKNITLSKYYQKINNVTPEQVVPLCRVNHLFKLDTSNSLRDTLLRSYIKSSVLDTRLRRRVYNSRTAVLPPTMGNRHSVSNIKQETGMHELVKKSFVLNKVSPKSLINIKGKTRTLSMLNTNIKNSSSKSSVLNCSSQRKLEKGMSCQKVVMNDQHVQKTTPASKRHTGPHMEKDNSPPEDCCFGEAVNMVNSGTTSFLQDLSQLPTPSTKISEQANPTWNGDGGECTSMNRILAWDPWAGLNKIGEDVSLSQLTETCNNDEPMDLVHETGKDITIVQSSPAVPVMSILKEPFKAKYNTAEDIHITMFGPITYSRSEERSLLGQQGGDAGPVVCEGDEVSERTTEKRVQWSQDVQVIYYAGDADEGNILGTQIEPLQEEADQQARANKYIKNFVESPKHIPFIDPWFPILRFNK